ncbi:DNA mismatch repair protein Mlh3 [Hondaea fermentalgiana]|uniref:DNA mismatch repair protein Mlh3 n=1 Tax=Hondaea fermentalgiana TaxID=2315210 RepID=A0A2R5GTK1_9STRA|nr:DNA mismatch repair protein Mlh3 [Hondaea fermentalgiana]|eukprot:GBG31214.1 DNA mismatch repair protein Mlh3 [Hondaea fermentalgiana]
MADGRAAAEAVAADPNPLTRLRPGVGEKLRASRNIASMAHAVEELVANALDAEARAVSVTVNPRVGFIRVEDNGCGMTRSVLERAGAAFSTSKLSAAESAALLRNGEAPTTARGFRGDALHALSHLGEVEIVSRPWRVADFEKNCAKTVLTKRLLRGRAEAVQASAVQGGSPGTQVTVHKIFADVPVRRARLEANAKETVTQIRRLLQRNALGSPRCAFALCEGDGSQASLVWKSAGGSSTRDVFGKLYGERTGKALLDRSLATHDFRLEALVSPADADAMHASSALQFIFVNGRPVPRVRRIEGLMNRLYRSHFERLDVSLDGPCFPAFVLSIECAPGLVDVLWEPSKSVVEFADWRRLLRDVEEMMHGVFDGAGQPLSNESNTQDSFASHGTAVSSTSSGSSRFFAAVAAAVFGDGAEACPPDPPALTRDEATCRNASKDRSGDGSAPTSKSAADAWREFRPKRRRTEEVAPSRACASETSSEAFGPNRTVEGVSLTRVALAECKIIAQVGAKFIFVQHENQILCVDQHAADERVRLETFEASLADRLGSAYVSKHILETFERVRLMPDQSSLLDDLGDELQEWGFSWRVDEFDTRAIILESVPAVFGVPLGVSALVEVLRMGAESPALVKTLLPPPIRNAAVVRACRGAIKFGDDLTHEQCVALVRKLSRCKFPFQCAHGRPSCVPLAGIVRKSALASDEDFPVSAHESRQVSQETRHQAV